MIKREREGAERIEIKVEREKREQKETFYSFLQSMKTTIFIKTTTMIKRTIAIMMEEDNHFSLEKESSVE